MARTRNESKKWLLMLYQIPAKSETDRVRIWRALQKIGAVAVKNSVSAVPDSLLFRKLIIEIASEIVDIGGEAIVTEGDFIFGLSENSLLQSYNAQLDADFKSLANEIRETTKEVSRKLTANELMKWEHKRTKFQSKIKTLTERMVSHLGGEDQCQSAFLAFEKKLLGSTDTGSKKSFEKPPAGSTWVTRRNPYVDRLASAWLIKKFIDPKAKILFVDMDTYIHKKGHLRFDVFNGEFGHVGDQCTFEVLVEKFKIRNTAVRALAEVIHDLDIQDQKYDRRETEGIRMALEGVIRSHKDDDQRLQHAMDLLDSLLLSLKKS
jgi:hypothetical protein